MAGIITICALCVLALCWQAQAQAQGKTARERAACLSSAPLTCVLSATSEAPAGFSARGVVEFKAVFSVAWPRASRCSLLITASVHNLTRGVHAFHIHEFGDARSMDGSSAGPHFSHPDPSLQSSLLHGFPYRADRHWGDLGNLHASSNGSARHRSIDRILTIDAIVGRTVVVHQGKDRGRSQQPSGDSGKRVAHGIIGFKNLNWQWPIVIPQTTTTTNKT